MNNDEKLLRRISREDRNRIEQATLLIKEGDFSTLDIKKLSGFENIYRVRVGKFRIKLCMRFTYNEILEITRRDDHTY